MADGGIANLVANFGELALNSIETPGRILLVEFHSQVDNHLADPRLFAAILNRIERLALPPPVVDGNAV